MNRRFIYALAGSVLFGLIAILIFQKILQNRVQTANQFSQEQIVYAVANIQPGTTITANQVRRVSHAAQFIPVGAFRSLEEVVGKVAQVPIEPNSPITAKLIATSRDSIFPITLPQGSRAMSIRVDEASSVSGFAKPGSYVDIVAVVTPGSGSKPVSKVIVQNLRVLAKGQETQAQPEGQNRINNTVTLQVTPAQAEILTLAMREGVLHLLLRHPADETLEPSQTVELGDFVSGSRASESSTAATKTSSQPAPNWPLYPTPPSQRETPTPTPTPNTSAKMAAIKVYDGNKPSEVMVKQ